LNYSFDQKWTNVASSRVLFILGNTAIQSFLTAANNQSKNFFFNKEFYNGYQNNGFSFTFTYLQAPLWYGYISKVILRKKTIFIFKKTLFGYLMLLT